MNIEKALLPSVYRLLAVLLLGCPAAPQLFAQTINLEVMVNTPAPTLLNDFFDKPGQFQITVNNNGPTRDVYFTLKVDGQSGEAAGLKLLLDESYNYEVPSGTTTVNNTNLLDFYLGVGPDDYSVTYAHGGQEDQVMAGYLPPGMYRLCVDVFDSNTDELLNSQGVPTCSSFNVTAYEAPQLTRPYDLETGISTEANAEDDVEVRWEPQLSLPIDAQIDYELEIHRIPTEAEVTSFIANNRPHDQFDALPQVDVLTDLVSPNYFTATDNVPLEEGDFYALRLRAVSPDISFRRNGWSNIVVFRYGEAASGPVDCTDPDYTLTTAYPLSGDTLPFVYVPQVVQFGPLCENIDRLRYAYGLRDQAAPGSLDLQSSRTIQWPNGPTAFLKNFLRDQGESDASINTYWLPDPVYATYLNLDPATVQPGGLAGQVSLTRGHDYIAAGGAEFRQTGGNFSDIVRTDELRNTGFHVGMPTPLPSFPAHEDTLTDARTQLVFTTGTAPASLLPPIKILTAIPGTTFIPTMRVREKMVVQLSTDPNFGQMSATWYKKLQANGWKADNEFDEDAYAWDDFSNENDNYPDRRYNEAAISAQVYKEFTLPTDSLADGDYYWRIGYVSDPDALLSANQLATLTGTDFYRTGPVRKFTIRAGGDSVIPRIPPPPANCGNITTADCVRPAPADITPITGLAAGQQLQIGYFDMEVRTVDNASGNTFTGTGVIPIPFLRNMRVLVDYTNIKYNASGRILSGTVEAQKDRDFSLDSLSTGLGSAVALAGDAAEDINGYLADAERLYSALTNNRELGMPVGLDTEIEGQTFIVAIMKMSFGVNKAQLMAVADIDIPALEAFSLNNLSVGVKDLCFNPCGLSNEGKMYLPRDHIWIMPDSTHFSMAGLEGATTEDAATWVSWDSTGFKSLNLVSKWQFPRSMMVPDTPNGQPGAGLVNASLTLRSSRGFNFMGMVTMDKFQLPSVPGWGFEATEAWVDYSDLENPTDLRANLPDNYLGSVLSASDPRVHNTWQGFYLKALRARMPEDFTNHSERASFGLRNVILDDQGLTLKATAENILAWSEGGHMQGWGVSIDTVHLSIVQNALTDAGLAGKLGIPVADETQQLGYQALLDNSQSNLAFNFRVSPVKDFSIPIAYATAVIEPTSYVAINLQSENHYLELLLNAKLSIDNEANDTPGEGDDMPGGLSMPGFVVEGFKYHSVTGFDDSQFSYRLASPQKAISGFPITLESFSISPGADPTLTIQPRVVLSGDNNGFAADATIVLQTSMNLSGEGRKYLRITNADLQAIHLQVVTSTLELDGMLNFYDQASVKGVAGNLTVKLPMNICASMSADFGTYRESGAEIYNTRRWYNYWRIEGDVLFGSGLTVFSGLSLYGLGGGVYSHMTQGNVSAANQPSGLASSAASGAPATCASGSTGNRTYQPDFDKNLGLKFSAAFGSQGDEGKAYNIGVLFGAEFSNSGGLTSLTLVGTAKVMSEGIGKPGDTPVSAYVDVNYSNPPEGSPSLDGQFFVKLNVYNTLVGRGTIPNPPPGFSNEHAFVEAAYLVNDEKWFLHCGKPDNRGGLMLQLGEQPIAQMGGYFMIGHDIPVTIPRPSDAFMRIYNGGDDPRRGGFDESSGDVESLINGNPRPPMALGEGFAFGADLSFEFNPPVQPFPFYFELGLALGFDINMTRSTDRVCAETTVSGGASVPLHPGVNDWYATGQIYAGIEGEFGIGVNLFFINGRFPILQAAAAMVLRGGLPNPAWAEGRARIRYRILGGLVKGAFNFEANLGNKCTPLTGDPMANIKVIQDLRPGDGTRDQSIFTKPAASFAITVNEIFELPQPDDPFAELPPRRIEPYVHSFTLHEGRTGGNGPVIPGQISIEGDNTAAILMPDNALRGFTWYSTRIEIRAREHLAGNRKVPVYTDQNQPWTDDEMHVFKTGEAPDHLVAENIQFTYPFQNQPYFLKGETRNGEGYIRLLQGRPELFPASTDEGVALSYHANFIPLDGGTAHEVPLTVGMNHRLLRFPVSQLDNGTKYAVQILRRRASTAWDQLVANSNLTNSSRVSGVLTRATAQYALLNAQVGTAEVTVQQTALPGPATGPREHLLYHYYFGTSDYDYFSEKMPTTGWQATHSSYLTKVRLPNLNEILDFNERYGYRANGTTDGPPRFPALVELLYNVRRPDGYPEIPGEQLDRYYYERYQPLIKSTASQIRSYLYRNGFSAYRLIPTTLQMGKPAWGTGTWSRSLLDVAQLTASYQAATSPNVVSNGSGGNAYYLPVFTPSFRPLQPVEVVNNLPLTTYHWDALILRSRIMMISNAPIFKERLYPLQPLPDAWSAFKFPNASTTRTLAATKPSTHYWNAYLRALGYGYTPYTSRPTLGQFAGRIGNMSNLMYSALYRNAEYYKLPPGGHILYLRYRYPDHSGNPRPGSYQRVGYIVPPGPPPPFIH